MPYKSSQKILSGTNLIHGDSEATTGLEVAPSISVTTSEYYNQLLAHQSITSVIAFRAPAPWKENDGLEELNAWNPDRHVYSRYTQNVSTRVEKVLSKVTVCGDVPLTNSHLF